MVGQEYDNLSLKEDGQRVKVVVMMMGIHHFPPFLIFCSSHLLSAERLSDEDNSAPPSTIGLDRRVAEKEINLTKHLKAFIAQFSVNLAPC